MHKTLGLDLGTDSISWITITESDTNQIVTHGTKLFSTAEVSVSSKKIKRKRIVITALSIIAIISLALSVINNFQWQFWLNIFFTSIISVLTLLYNDKHEK